LDPRDPQSLLGPDSQEK